MPTVIMTVEHCPKKSEMLVFQPPGNLFSDEPHFQCHGSGDFNVKLEAILLAHEALAKVFVGSCLLRLETFRNTGCRADSPRKWIRLSSLPKNHGSGTLFVSIINRTNELAN